LSSLISATFNRTERLQCEGQAYAIEKLTLTAGKAAEISAFAELSAKQQKQPVRFCSDPIGLEAGMWKIKSEGINGEPTALLACRQLLVFALCFSQPVEL
jgi:hypothetical protein